jgi:hypothetical protein
MNCKWLNTEMDTNALCNTISVEMLAIGLIINEEVGIHKVPRGENRATASQVELKMDGKKIPFRPVPFSTFDLTVSVFTEKYRNRTETEEGLFRPFLRDPVFFGLNPYLFHI